MFWNKYSKLIILKKNNFNIPNLCLFNWKEHNLNYPLILRSSHNLEDSNKHSFAWIFDSFYPIYSLNDIKKWIKYCEKWFKKEKTISYLKINKINNFDLKKNYILQEYIEWDLSWVIFTKHNNDFIRIEFVPWINYWLTDWLLSWTNIFLFNKNNLSDFSLEWICLSDFCYWIYNWKIIKKNSLDNELILNIFMELKNELLSMALDIEKIFWSPQDIEFTIKNKKIYILQSRDITF